jgi:hypothetical protein
LCSGKRTILSNSSTSYAIKSERCRPNADSLDALNPFAVTLRYDLFETEAVDRDWIAKAVAAVRAWAETAVETTRKPESSKPPEE